MKVNTTKFTGYVLLALALVLVGTVIYKNNTDRHVPLVFSPQNMLESLWAHYKEDYLEEGTSRAIDRQRDDITTSEGQSYSMLRAVWLDDHETFDASWQWTKDNLQVPGGYLFSWLFGKKADGQFGVLTDAGGQNSASDADTDIALALAFASARWKNPQYLGDARTIIKAIWDEEVVMIAGKPYMAANNVEKKYSDDVVVNPSYLAPYAYRIFAEIDPEHDWNGVIDTSYAVIQKSMTDTLDKTSSAHLPPNWVSIRRRDGVLVPLTGADLNTNYSYDALRVPWRMMLDWRWYGEPRARAVLTSFTFLDQEWLMRSLLSSEYGHDGSHISNSESPAMYGGSLGAFLAINESHGKDVYEKKLQSLYDPDTESWRQPLGYYDSNWAWFGMALYHDELPNLWALSSAASSTASERATSP